MTNALLEISSVESCWVAAFLVGATTGDPALDLGSESVLEIFFFSVFVVSTTYLVWRSIALLVRQVRSYRALPFAHHVPESTCPASCGGTACAAMIGIALGDALGMPRESLPAWLARVRFGDEPRLSRGLIRVFRRRGTVSDDTQLTVAVARSIRDKGTFDAARFASELTAWWRIRIGPGRATSQAVRRIIRGSAETGDPDSQGNGAAMRVVPLAIAHLDDLDGMLAAVKAMCAPTHANAEAIAGAEVLARAVRLVLRDEELAVDALLPEAASQEVERWRELLGSAVSLAGTSDDGLSALGTTGWVFHTVPSVLYMFHRWPDDFSTGLSNLYRVGGDTDTIGALYGALVGARHGTKAFDPWPWRDVQGVGVLVDEAHRIA